MSEHRAAKRSIELIERVATAQEPVSLSELARSLGMPKSSAHALARTLADEGFLDRTVDNGRYGPGPRLLKLVHALQGRFRLAEVAEPIVKQVAQDLGETVLLGVLHQHSLYYVTEAEAPQPLRFVPPVGEPRPLHNTSIGKLFLAFMTQARRDSLLGSGPLAAETPFTVVDRDVLYAELDAIRLQGYATNREESVAACSAVGVPVWQPTNEPDPTMLAGLSAAGPTERIVPRITDVRDRLLIAAQAIAERL